MNDELVITIEQPVVGHLGNIQDQRLHIPLRPLLAGLMANGLLSNPELRLSDPGDYVSNRAAIANTSCLLTDAMLKRGDEKPEADEAQG